MIAAIYESVIRPELFDEFIEVWEAHIQAALEEVEQAGKSDDLGLDPELQAHFARAYEILEQIGRKTPRADLEQKVRKAVRFAMLASPDGRVVASSAAAMGVLGAEATLDDLRTELTVSSVRLLDDMANAAQQRHQTGPPVVLATGFTPRHLIARVAEDHDPDDTQNPLLMIEALEYHWSPRAEDMLVTSFGLSPAEVDIVRNLLDGFSLREIANQSGRSEHTVRNQTKSVLAKTGAPGQVELIRLVAYLINQDANAGGGGRSTDLPCETMTMASGLRMQVFRAGASQGCPVIFLHGLMDGLSPLRYLREKLDADGFRVIAPARPGFGRSDPVIRPDQALETAVAHVGELIDRLELDRPIILAQLSGTVPGHVAACRLEDRIAGLVCVGAGPPVVRLNQLAAMARRQRVAAYTARFAPALLPTVVRAAIAQIDNLDSDSFMSSLYRPGTHDHDLIQRLNLHDLIHEGYRFSLEQGTRGFVPDSYFVVRDWSSHIDGHCAPSILLHGGQDPVWPLSITQDYYDGRENVDFRVEPDCGQLLLYEKPDVVMAALRDMAKNR